MEIKGVTENIVDYIRIKIIICEIEPGQKIDENGWSSRLNVSRQPLRDALRILEKENLVKNIPRKGTHVTEMSKEDMKSVWQTREMIECNAISLLGAQEITDIPEATLDLDKATNYSIPSTDNLEDYLKYYYVLSKFHFKLIEATGNEWLMHFKKAIFPTQVRYRLPQIYKPSAGKACIEDHRKILQAINIGAYDQARERTRTHVWDQLC